MKWTKFSKNLMCVLLAVTVVVMMLLLAVVVLRERQVESSAIEDVNESMLLGKMYHRVGDERTTYINKWYGYKFNLPANYYVFENALTKNVTILNLQEFFLHGSFVLVDRECSSPVSDMDTLIEKRYDKWFGAGGVKGSIGYDKITSFETLNINGIPARKIFLNQVLAPSSD